MWNNLKRKLKNRLLSHLLGLTPSSIFTLDASKRPVLDGEPLTFEQLSNLDREAKYIQSTQLWKVLTDTLTAYGQKMIWERSKTIEDLASGKMVLYTVDVQKKIVYNICSEYEKAQAIKKQKEVGSIPLIRNVK